MGRSVIPVGMSQTTAELPATNQIASDRLAELSDAVVGVFRGHYGRAPAEAQSLHYGEHVITVLHGGLTGARTMLSPEMFHEGMNGDVLRVAERALGRRVLSHRSSIHPESHISFELFLLADETWDP
jgi:hypothetical protein